MAKRLAYNLSPPTYHDYAQRAAHLWDCFVREGTMEGNKEDNKEGNSRALFS